MATNTLLQYLQADDGSGTALGITASNRRQVERFIASSAVAAGDIVCLDITKTALGEKGLFVLPADRSSSDKVVAIGFAIAAAAANEEVDVTVAGLHKDAAVVTAIAAGARLVAPDVAGGGTAGRAEEYTASLSVPPIAYCLKTASGNQADVFVIKQF